MFRAVLEMVQAIHGSRLQWRDPYSRVAEHACKAHEASGDLGDR